MTERPDNSVRFTGACALQGRVPFARLCASRGRMHFASPNLPRTDFGSVFGLRRRSHTPEAHTRSHAYNGDTSCDPDITGELSEERFCRLSACGGK